MEFGDQRLGCLLKPQSLAFLESHNESSYQEQRHSSSLLFCGINQVSYNSRDNSMDLFDDDEVDNITIQPASKKFHDDDFCLRVANGQRRDFANKHLFKSGAKVVYEEEPSSDEYYSEGE